MNEKTTIEYTPEEWVAVEQLSGAKVTPVPTELKAFAYTLEELRFFHAYVKIGIEEEPENEIFKRILAKLAVAIDTRTRN